VAEASSAAAAMREKRIVERKVEEMLREKLRKVLSEG
jgi:hypothetical protein